MLNTRDDSPDSLRRHGELPWLTIIIERHDKRWNNTRLLVITILYHCGRDYGAAVKTHVVNTTEHGLRSPSSKDRDTPNVARTNMISEKTGTASYAMVRYLPAGAVLAAYSATPSVRIKNALVRAGRMW